MPSVLTTDSIIQCPHSLPGPPPVPAGQLQFTNVNNKLKVKGKPVLLKNDISNALVNGCQNPPSGTTSQPCKKVNDVTSGETSKLKVGGTQVVLDTLLKGDTDGFPPNPSPLKVVQVQSKLKVS